jgi:deazaflavin-dependent oxidoreductase (nitroreductase family)
MAKTYRRHLGTRIINWWFRALTKLGLGASYREILTVPGRKTGRPHSTPVDVIEVGGDRWLVAGYGPANWVLNTRAHGEVTLRRGRHSETYKVEGVGAAEAIPVLRKYIAEIRVTRSYFDATSSSSDAAVAAELPRHPVFRLIPSTPNRNENK